MMQRYRTAFLLSSLFFVALWAVYLNLPQVEKKLKEIEKKVIQISIVTPIVPVVVPKKVEIKKPEIPQAIIPIVKPKPKVKPKKVIKKVVIKPKPKKIVKKVIKKPKPKPKKIIKKVVKKAPPKKVKPKKIVKKVVKRVEPIEEFYYTPQPIIKREPLVQPKVYTPPPPKPKAVYVPKAPPKRVAVPTPPAPIANNGKAKKAFLKNVRNKILVNKKYPKLAQRRHIEGSVTVKFDITASGQVSNIRFINGKTVFHKSIRKTLQRTFPIGIPSNMKSELPIYDIVIPIHFKLN